ncbi:MAG: CPXCG motif-containing cysteine-rich protein [Rhodanobacteraceae bacterium]|nr:CPXCG motif-containing cysteine-rich protein [Rhodanobacteraceae bacterium]
MLEFVRLHCPHCGESFDSRVDLSAGDQDYIEDCAVCCRPITVLVRVGTDCELLGVQTRRDQD